MRLIVQQVWLGVHHRGESCPPLKVGQLFMQPHAPNPVPRAGDEVHAANREIGQTIHNPDAHDIRPWIMSARTP